MILLIDETYHNARFDNLHLFQNYYNMTELRMLSDSIRTSILFVDRSRHYTRTIVHTFLPTYRMFSEENMPAYPKYYNKSKSFERMKDHLDETPFSDFSVIQFYYSLKFRKDQDTPHDPKIPVKTILLEDGKNKEDISSEIPSVFYTNPFDPVEEGSLVIGSKELKRCCAKDFATSLVEYLSEYYDIKAALKILQTEFRLNDILDCSEEEFSFNIYEKIARMKDIKTWNLESSDGKIHFDFAHEIEEKNIQKAIRKLTGWRVPEESDRDANEFEPLRFELLNDQFYFMPLPSNPLRGFIVPKKFYKNRGMFCGKVLTDIELLIYDPSTLQEIEVFHRCPTEYSDMDVLAQIERMLDILSLRYKGAARAIITISIGNRFEKSIIVEDSIYNNSRYTSQQEPLERVYEMIFGT